MNETNELKLKTENQTATKMELKLILKTETVKLN